MLAKVNDAKLAREFSEDLMNSFRKGLASRWSDVFSEGSVMLRDGKLKNGTVTREWTFEDVAKAIKREGGHISVEGNFRLHYFQKDHDLILSNSTDLSERLSLMLERPGEGGGLIRSFRLEGVYLQELLDMLRRWMVEGFNNSPQGENDGEALAQVHASMDMLGKMAGMISGAHLETRQEDGRRRSRGQLDYR